MKNKAYFEKVFASEENLAREMVRWLSGDDEKELRYNEQFKSSATLDFRLASVLPDNYGSGLSVTLMATFISTTDFRVPLINIFPKSFICRSDNPIILVGNTLAYGAESIFEFVRHFEQGGEYSGLGDESNWGLTLGLEIADKLYGTSDPIEYFDEIIFSISRFTFGISSYFHNKGYKGISTY